MTVIPPLLDRLCSIYGIALDYIDARGEQRSAPLQTKLALLAALGLAVDEQTDLQPLLEEIEARSWRCLLAPVLVVKQTAARLRIPLQVEAGTATTKCHWKLKLESGEVYDGQVYPRDLEVMGVYGEGAVVRYGLPLPLTLPTGYHELQLTRPDRSARMRLIVVPERCYEPPMLAEGGRIWGAFVQLYALRSQRNWGIGDFNDLKVVLEGLAERGAALLGLNPLHALFPCHPNQVDPYSPSSRLFLNVLYLDVEAVGEFTECPAAQETVNDARFQARLRALRAGEQVDYATVAEIKLEVLERLYEHFRDHHLTDSNDPRAAEFRTYQEAEGEALYRQALFDALHEHFRRENPTQWNWPTWPVPYHDPTSAEVTAFAADHRERIEFYQYLQWLAAQQLEAVNEKLQDLGIGLYQDVATGLHGGGAEVWAGPGLYVTAASIGQPPNDVDPQGQDWGLAPCNPQRLHEAAFEPFIAVLRKNMRGRGALGIDLGSLRRLFWVPAGANPEEGTFVDYPFEDLLGILALESQRNRCLVIANDSAPAPDFDEQVAESLTIFSRRSLYATKRPDGDFQSPDEYPIRTLAAVSTPELPPLYAYWQGVDLSVRDRLGLFPNPIVRDTLVLERSQDRARLRLALNREGLLPANIDVSSFPMPVMTPELSRAVSLYVARSPAQVMLVRMEDVFEQVEQVILAGYSGDQYPSWRYKLSLNLEEWFGDERLLALVGALREERGSRLVAGGLPERSLVKSRIPDATYRLQFHSGFQFTQAIAIVPYLRALGISHCYASPYLRARPGSTHGYDIIDHHAINPEIGSREDCDRFSKVLRMHDMGQILDIVPNHMGVMGSDNAWWLDVLENGRAAAHAPFFDIDWQPYQQERRGKVLLPVLGNHYGMVLENGELRLVFQADSGALHVRYYEHTFPIDPRTYPRILGYRIEQLEARLGSTDTSFLEYQSLVTAFGHLPEHAETSPEKAAERQRDKEIHKRHLAELCQRSPDIAWFVEENLHQFNGTVGVPSSFDTLHALLETQAYRLSFWRVAADSINYRRFFDINDLAGLRMENAAVFQETHGLVLELLATGKLDGLRIDHPDGLYNPQQYFQRLQEALVPAGNAVSAAAEKPLYVVVEKILEGYERLPQGWAVHGTTGYDYANLVNGLQVDARAEAELTRIYEEFIGTPIDFEELLYQCKKLIMQSALASELGVLATQISRIAQLDRSTRDFSPLSLWHALTEIVACFPVYRTYITPEGFSEDDKRYVDWAISKAKRRSLAANIGTFDFVRDVLLTVAAEGKPAAFREAVIAFAMKFQQYTGPLMAKGLEDTAFYRYHRLASLNEVGGDPSRFAVSVSGFHYANQERARLWPHAMLSTSTHDSKRSEDVRARLNVLSELPQEWEKQLKRWSRLNRNKKRLVDDKPVPSANDEYLLYQTLLGAWPLEELDNAQLADVQARIENYMLKAIKEAKQHSSWINPDAAYEEAMVNFIRALLESGKNRFLEDFLPFQRCLARFGLFNSLSQTLLKLTSPGVPDIYQGNDIWDFSLVDPDCRRPVDYRRRKQMLRDLQSLVSGRGKETMIRVRSLLDSLEDGRAKLFVIWKTLTLRRQNAALFRHGDYLPLTVTGPCADHVCAFIRGYQDQQAIIVVPRLFKVLLNEKAEKLPLGEAVWGDTRLELPAGGEKLYVNAFTGEVLACEVQEGSVSLPLVPMLDHFPVALLLSD